MCRFGLLIAALAKGEKWVPIKAIKKIAKPTCGLNKFLINFTFINALVIFLKTKNLEFSKSLNGEPKINNGEINIINKICCTM